MLKRQRPAALAALLAMLSAGTAQAQQEHCATRAEINAALQFALPDVIASVGAACRTTLGDAAFLSTDAPALVQRYRDVRPDPWPQTRSALGKMRNGPIQVGTLPDEVLKPLVAAIIKQEITKAVKPKDCVAIDPIVRLLAPLPPENMAGLLTLIAVRFESGNKDKSKNFFCSADPASVVLPAPKP